MVLRVAPAVCCGFGPHRNQRVFKKGTLSLSLDRSPSSDLTSFFLPVEQTAAPPTLITHGLGSWQFRDFFKKRESLLIAEKLTYML
jgi:hypothetical protein